MENITPPTLYEVANECLCSIKYKMHFDQICQTHIATINPDMLIKWISGQEPTPRPLKTDIALFIDFIINCTYLPILYQYYYPDVKPKFLTLNY